MAVAGGADPVLSDIAHYVLEYPADGAQARDTAHLCLMDSLGCALLALGYPECARHIAPVVPGAILPGGARVPGTALELDPVQAAFCTGTLIRWLDYNDTWLAAEWGHPSDNLGGVLALTDYLSRRRRTEGRAPFTVADVLTAMIKAHELQGVLALENSFNRVGLDHVLLVRIASAAVCTALLGGGPQEVIAVLSHAFIDGGALRTYRHAPNTGPRKSWAAGDATSRGVRLALMAVDGETGYRTALSAPRWGFEAVVLRGQGLRVPRPFASYVMENVLFKVAYPAEFHAQTAVEAATCLHPQVAPRLDEVEGVRLETQEPAVRIIDKQGPLRNAADRDHCLQYMVAVGLIYGDLTADHYSDAAAADPRIDALRGRMTVVENPQYSRDYLDPDKRSIANALQVRFRDGTETERVAVEYPIGHPRRRRDALPLLQEKLRRNLASRLPPDRVASIEVTCRNRQTLEPLAVDAFLGLFDPVADPPSNRSLGRDVTRL
jgi:2-methylcitrate dehydratase